MVSSKATVAPGLVDGLRRLGASAEAIAAVQNARDAAIPQYLDLRYCLEVGIQEIAMTVARRRGFNPDTLERDWAQTRRELVDVKLIFEEEDRFLAGLYNLLSPQVHRARFQPLVSAPLLRNIVLDVLSELLGRLQQPRLEAGPAGPYPGKYIRAALELIDAFQHRNRMSASFEIRFTRRQADAVRALLKDDDFGILLEVIEDPDWPTPARRWAAALALSQYHKELRGPVGERLETVYSTLRHPDDWVLEKAIVLALTNQLGKPKQLLQYLQRLDADPELKEANLADSEDFYQGVTETCAWYIRALEGAEPARTVWEMYYLRERANTLPIADLNRLIDTVAPLQGRVRDSVRAFYQKSRQMIMRIAQERRREQAQ